MLTIGLEIKQSAGYQSPSSSTPLSQPVLDPMPAAVFGGFGRSAPRSHLTQRRDQREQGNDEDDADFDAGSNAGMTSVLPMSSHGQRL
jgi:hypothetical protein